MARHRSRQHATHRLTATRTEQTGEDAYGAGSPTTEPVDVIGGTADIDAKRVEYSSAGTSYVRESTGERVREAPTVSGNATLARDLEEGDTVTLVTLDPAAPDLGPFEVRSIDVRYARGRARVGSATVELENL